MNKRHRNWKIQRIPLLNTSKRKSKAFHRKYLSYSNNVSESGEQKNQNIGLPLRPRPHKKKPRSFRREHASLTSFAWNSKISSLPHIPKFLCFDEQLWISLMMCIHFVVSDKKIRKSWNPNRKLKLDNKWQNITSNSFQNLRNYSAMLHLV